MSKGKVIEIKINDVTYIVSEVNRNDDYLKQIIKDMLIEILKFVFLNENLVIIGSGAFTNCSNLEKVFFNNALKRISEAVFFNSGLKNVVILDSVEYIGKNAFTNGKIYCESFSKPDGWHDNFISNKAVVLWGNEWEYDENGEPRVK